MSSHEEVPFEGGKPEELAEAATVLRAHGQDGYCLSASKEMSAPPYGRREPGELLVCKPLAPARVPTGLLSSPWQLEGTDPLRTLEKPAETQRAICRSILESGERRLWNISSTVASAAFPLQGSSGLDVFRAA
jgi:hypothetical protein